MELSHLTNPGLARQRDTETLLSCNRFTAPQGLSLTAGEALALSQRREQALRQTGRLEFGDGILQKLLLAFHDSPFLTPHDYADTLGELTEIFYTYKNECGDALTDDELLTVMRATFDGPCQGSVDLLAGRELAELAQSLRRVRPFDWDSSGDGGEDEEAMYNGD